MKKILAMVAVGASAVAAVADPTEVPLGTIGVTKIAGCSTTNTIIAVSFADLAGGAISASNIVKTTNLTYGDTLRVYDDTGNFKVFTLDGVEPPHFWRETLMQNLGSGDTSADPGTTTMGAGVGLWLVRGSNWTGASFDIYLYGAVTASYPHDAGSAVSIANNVAKLFGNPLQSDVMPVITGMQTGDKIIIAANNASGTKIYTWSADKNSWGSGVGARRTTLTAIPKGTGFWYAPNGSGAARTLYWTP